jgi:hypothetical protein
LVVLINLRPSDPAVPFLLRVLPIGLALAGFIDTIFAAGLPQRLPDHTTNAAQPPAQADGGLVSTVRAGNLVFAAVSINHSPNTWWLIDTGASMCEFDLETAKRLQLKRSTRYRLTSNPKNWGEHFAFFETPDLLVGSIQCGPLVVLAHPLIQALNGSKTPPHWSGTFERTGLLGMNLLSSKGALINWRKQRIYLDPTDEQTKSKTGYESEGYTAIPFTLTASRQIQIEGTLGSNHHQFCLDTGSPKTMIDQSIVEQDRLPSRLTNSVVRSPMKEFKDSKVSQVVDTRFSLGDFDLSDRKILAASFHLTNSNHGDIWAGLIGADVLWDYDAVIDLGSNTLYLREKQGDRDFSGNNTH